MSIDWKKTLIVACDIVVATYLLLAVTAFNKPDAKDSHVPERLRKRCKRARLLRRLRFIRHRVAMSASRSNNASQWLGSWQTMARTTIWIPMAV